jgi:putative membrane protein
VPSIETSKSNRIPIHRYVTDFVVSGLSFWFIAWILPGISIRDWGTAFVAAALMSILNAIIWPIIARYFARALLWTAGLLVLFLNGALLMAVDELLDGLVVDGWWVALFASLFMTAATVIISSVLSLDDDAVFQRRTMRRMVDRLEPPTPTDVPGVLFLQIDGLAEPVLRRAIAAGTVPTLARWVRGGTHQITGWECDLSSQTGASQAGILHGNNENMPAFRWYDKDLGKVLTSNRPRDAAIIEHRQSDGHGLLVDGGVSRSNVFSGDSQDSILTFSTVTDRSKHSKHTTNYVLSDPYAVSRLLALTVADIVREMIDRRTTRHLKIEPRLKRGGIYPVLRAATTTILRDLTLYTLMSDVYRGVPAAYVDFVGYDEVAHHSGIFASTAMDTLSRLDRQLGRLEQAIGEAPRPYHVVVLSDHGQSQGATFLQRYGVTLEQVVSSLIDEHHEVEVPKMVSEGWGNLNGALTEVVNDKSSRLGKLIGALVQGHTVDDDVVLGPGYDDEVKARSDVPRDPADVVVLASGNLGLISFTKIDGRATFETLGTRYPGLLAGLAEHPGIGFVLVHSENLGPLAIGGTGIRYLIDDRVEGEDPLASFGPNCADHLRRTSSFVNAPDILVNSFFDPHADEGAAFEELIGFHGGLGGEQSMPFILHPSVFPMPADPIVGAATVHHLFKGWLAGVHDGELGAPWTLPAEAPIAPLPQIAS